MSSIAEKSCQQLFLVDAFGKRKEVSRHNMNKKADVRLKKMAEYFQDTLLEYCEISEEQFLCKVMTMHNCEPLERILMIYDVENRFAAISYNLILQSFYTKEENWAYQFELQYGGMLHINDAAFFCTSGVKTEYSKRAQEILNTLNEPIIIQKIMELNLLQVVLKYSMVEKYWIISVKSMVGSSTWILIPPVMQTIMPKRREVYALAEIMRMLQSAVL